MKNFFDLPRLAVSVLAVAASVNVQSHAQLPVAASAGTIVASGLNGPRGLAFGDDGTLYVAEAGTGGANPTKGVCPQVPGPIGPYTGGTTARISAIATSGKRTTLASGLPSSLSPTGNVQGVADISFLDGKLYALIAGGGCSHGNPLLPNGIVRVNVNNGNWTYITDLSVFYLEHPAAYPNLGDFEPDGVPYSILAHNSRLFAVEPNHGMITATTSDGATSEIIDMSLSEGHIVPTSIAANGNNLYVGNLGLFPIEPTFERVITLTRDLGFIDTTPGLATKAADINNFRIANSRAGFTSIVSLKFGPDGLLYALELSDYADYPTPGYGKVVRLNANGKIEEVVTGLSVPTGMTFGPDRALYISNFGAASAGKGQVVRIAIPM